MGGLNSKQSKIKNTYFWDNIRRKSRTKNTSQDIEMPAHVTQNNTPEINLEDVRYFFEFIEEMDKKQQLEHFQPPEFPLIPVIKSNTHSLTNNSWRAIASTDYENSSDTQTDGKIKGTVYFYNRFFELLFTKSADFKSKFPNIQMQAHVMGNIIALCVAVKLEEIELIRKQLKDLGLKHTKIVYDPWQYSIFATTMHSTIKLCLGDKATPEIMSAWLNVLAFVLRAMLPTAIEHIRPYAGATNAAGIVTENDQIALKLQRKVKEFRAISEDKSEGKTPDLRRSNKIGLFNQTVSTNSELGPTETLGTIPIISLPGTVNNHEMESVNQNRK